MPLERAVVVFWPEMTHYNDNFEIFGIIVELLISLHLHDFFLLTLRFLLANIVLLL